MSLIYSSVRASRAWLRSIAAAIVLSALVPLMVAMPAVAAESDCMGTSPDGKAICTAPILQGYSYNLCASSQIGFVLREENRCRGPNIFRSESELQTLMGCLGGGSKLSWMPRGSISMGTDHFCYTNLTVNYKYGTEVAGFAAQVQYPYGTLVPVRFRSSVCPHGYVAVGPSSLPDYCKKPPRYCGESTPNPMGVACADHGRTEQDIAAAGNSPLELTRYYSSTAYYRPLEVANTTTLVTPTILNLNLKWNLRPGFGDYWRHTYDRRIMPEDAPYLMATASRPSGINKHFRPDGTLAINEDGRADRLIRLADTQGNLMGWRYFSDEGVETYASSGELMAINTRGGRTITLFYSVGIYGSQPPGLLAEVRDDTGRYLRFIYDHKLRVSEVTDSAGHAVIYSYFDDTEFGGLMLGGVTYPGGASRRYTYADDPLGRNGDEFGLTGIYDEFGIRLASYGYGSAAYVEYSGGTSRYLRNEISATQVAITDPLGTVRTQQLQTVSGVPRIASITQPPGFGSAAATAYRRFDSVGNLASRDDFDGRRTCFANDTARLLETVRVEGLPNTASCSQVLEPSATLPVPARKITTKWHPGWRLTARRAEPGRITSYVYHGQADPTSGNVIASCAPASAKLPGDQPIAVPDDQPIAVLCKQVEQATTDTNGSLGFDASLAAGVPNRIYRWTYNEFGQKLTEKDALDRTTTFAYYDKTSVDYTKGDLKSVTDAATHVTRYTKYNKRGQLLESIDPNEVVSIFTYDSRQRLKSQSVGGQVTGFDYFPTGLLKQVTQPDQSFVSYEFDQAHRLVAVVDNRGNRIDYELDNAGNRIKETAKDASGALRKQLVRSIDALGRVQSMTLGRVD